MEVIEIWNCCPKTKSEILKFGFVPNWDENSNSLNFSFHSKFLKQFPLDKGETFQHSVIISTFLLSCVTLLPGVAGIKKHQVQ